MCYLLGIRNVEQLRLHPLRGSIFENFVVMELRKAYLHHGRRAACSSMAEETPIPEENTSSGPGGPVHDQRNQRRPLIKPVLI